MNHVIQPSSKNLPDGPKIDSADTSRFHVIVYAALADYSFAPSMRPDPNTIVSADYYECGLIDGINYYTPNDEDWGGIIAVDHVNKKACYTGFYEMDDMEVPDSDYAIVLHEGALMCRFELPEPAAQ